MRIPKCNSSATCVVALRSGSFYKASFKSQGRLPREKEVEREAIEGV
jgi:hypothetical protein